MTGRQDSGRQAPQRPLILQDKIGFVPAESRFGEGLRQASAVTLGKALAWSRFFGESAKRSQFHRPGWLPFSR